MIINGDSLHELKNLEDNSIDAVITDPPYGYSFMGKDWDKAVPSVEIWQECLRVLKPGGWCMVMSAPRSDVQNAMISRLMEAGFRLDFTPIYWTYASGFPKAGNVGKLVDKRNGRDAEQFKALGSYLRELRGTMPQKAIAQHFPSKTGRLTGCVANWELGLNIPTLKQWAVLKTLLPIDNRFDELIEREEAEREVVGQKTKGSSPLAGNHSGEWTDGQKDGTFNVTVSATPQAKALDGSYTGFQPKPAVEVIIVAMKPLGEKTYVDQALKNGKGITWLDSVRIPSTSDDTSASALGLSLDISDGNAVASLLKACEQLRGSALPTTSCSKSCTAHDLHAFDGDCSWGKGLRQWLSVCQHGDAEHEKPYLGLSGSPADCPACSRLYDEQSQTEAKDGLNASPLHDDALADICALLREHSDSPLSQCTVLHANYDELSQLVRSYYNYTRNGQTTQGRFPANLLVSDDVLNDGVVTKSGKSKANTYEKHGGQWGQGRQIRGADFGDSGSYSRYFDLDKWAAAHLPEQQMQTFPFAIFPKASKSEKNKGLEALPNTQALYASGSNLHKNGDGTPRNKEATTKNHHPTVKPLKLMSYLITLTTREGDTVLDPFVGSGTTVVAAKQLGRKGVGIEREEEYAEIARARVEAVNEAEEQLSLV